MANNEISKIGSKYEENTKTKDQDKFNLLK
jgi:hypothetical protein